MSSDSTTAPIALETLVQRLAPCGEKLPPEVRAEILALGNAAVPELIRIIEDDDLAEEDAVGEGWVPIHAVDLLTDLKAEEAVGPLLSTLMRTGWEEILHDRVAIRLPDFGAKVFEPGVALMETLEDVERRTALCSVLAQIGVRDERIFEWCKQCFHDEPMIGAVNFGYYGDEQALPLLRQAIEAFEPDWESSIGMVGLADYVEAYEAIAELPEDLAASINALREEWEEHRARVEAAPQPVTAPRKVGRNEPCPCASGKKFKRCCGA